MTLPPISLSDLVVLVTGGRDYANRSVAHDVLRQLSPRLVIHGGADGADRLAHVWARANRCPQRVFLPAWHTHGRAAGPLRNARMLDHLRSLPGPYLVVAFPGGRGTADMVSRARAQSLRVLEIAA